MELEKVDNIKISSKKIREYIESGKMEKAQALLGRPYRICGLVVEGDHNGQKIDFPTANLELDYPYVFPKEENAFTKYVNKVIDEKECGHEVHSDLSFEDFVKQEKSKREDFKVKLFGTWQDDINTEAVKLGEECKKK